MFNSQINIQPILQYSNSVTLEKTRHLLIQDYFKTQVR